MPVLRESSTFGRLFGPATNSVTSADEEKLIKLGQSMRDEEEREGTLTPRTGYTYLGQFIAHDLTLDDMPLAGDRFEPELTRNYRAARLDLEHVYGGGPAVSPQLYEGAPGEETFKIGGTSPGGIARDLPRDDGRLLLGDGADPRNAINLIVRQLHVLFLKFHNEALRQLRERPEAFAVSANCNGSTLFARAQRLVQWHYQWIVRHDYLPRVVNPSVWTMPRTARKPCANMPLPVEFSLAAFRFGHSMVRNAYSFNCRRPRIELDEMMLEGRSTNPLRDELLIEWGKFFDGLPASGPVGSSSFIDTSITRHLHGMSADSLAMCGRGRHVDSPAVTLPVRTLLRGARARLPSGQQIARHLVDNGILHVDTMLSQDELMGAVCNSSPRVLEETRLGTETPLFYYVLKEAEVKAGGQSLGPVGSYIVSDVIQAALESDPTSYLTYMGPNWQRPRWRFPNSVERPINNMIGIVQLVGDDKLLPECHRLGQSC